MESALLPIVPDYSVELTSSVRISQPPGASVHQRGTNPSRTSITCLIAHIHLRRRRKSRPFASIFTSSNWPNLCAKTLRSWTGKQQHSAIQHSGKTECTSHMSPLLGQRSTSWTRSRQQWNTPPWLTSFAMHTCADWHPSYSPWTLILFHTRVTDKNLIWHPRRTEKSTTPCLAYFSSETYFRDDVKLGDAADHYL